MQNPILMVARGFDLIVMPGSTVQDWSLVRMPPRPDNCTIQFMTMTMNTCTPRHRCSDLSNLCWQVAVRRLWSTAVLIMTGVRKKLHERRVDGTEGDPLNDCHHGSDQFFNGTEQARTDPITGFVVDNLTHSQLGRIEF